MIRNISNNEKASVKLYLEVDLNQEATQSILSLIQRSKSLLYYHIIIIYPRMFTSY